MNMRDILGRFSHPKRLNNDSYQVACPCHNDKKNSLTITERDGKILMHCHAGCRTEDIVARVGLTMRDLSNDNEQKEDWTSKLSYMGKLEAVYNYGEYVKLRFEGKKIIYGTLKDCEFTKGIGNIPKTLYNLEKVKRAGQSGYPVFIVEGEKDVGTLASIGYAATTAGGVSDWKKEFAQHFRGAKVVILPDNDEPGRNLAERIKKDLRNIAAQTKVVITSQVEKGDVTDYLKENTASDLKDLINSVPYNYADWIVTKNDVPSKINADKLAYSISKNLNYVMLKRQGYDVSDFYTYENGVYNKCSKQEFKSYIKSYIPIGLASDATLNNIYNLVGASGNNVYEFDDANSDENIINLQNGILNLDTGKLEQHSPNVLSTLQLNCKYDEQAQAPVFMKYVNKLCSDADGKLNEQKLNLLQEWTGLLISNIAVNRVKKCLVLYSALGNTGKTVYLNTISLIIGGEHTINIPIQILSDRFAISDLYGKRLDVIGDQQADDIYNSSGFKQLTGGDRVKVEFKGKQSFDWVFRGGIVISCNDLPCFRDDKGGHVFERISILPCDSQVSAAERDSRLIDKIAKETDGIFQWALAGLYRLINNNFQFTKCQASENIMNEYRANIDTLYRFIDECYEITGDVSDKIKKSKFEDVYSMWCTKNEYTAIKKRNIKERAEKIGIGLIKTSGIYYYKGIREKIVFEEVPESENLELPEEWR